MTLEVCFNLLSHRIDVLYPTCSEVLQHCSVSREECPPELCLAEYGWQLHMLSERPGGPTAPISVPAQSMPQHHPEIAQSLSADGSLQYLASTGYWSSHTMIRESSWFHNSQVVLSTLFQSTEQPAIQESHYFKHYITIK